MSTKAKGKPSQLRPLKEDAITANQYIRSPKQELFLDHYLEPTSPTFGNAYRSALEAGYSESYAKQITSPAIENNWITENPRIINLTDRHIQAGIDHIATDTRVKTADRLKAYELAAKLRGLLIDRKQVESKVLTISLGDVLGLSEAKTPPQTPPHS